MSKRGRRHQQLLRHSALSTTPHDEPGSEAEENEYMCQKKPFPVSIHSCLSSYASRRISSQSFVLFPVSFLRVRQHAEVPARMKGTERHGDRDREEGGNKRSRKNDKKNDKICNTSPRREKKRKNHMNPLPVPSVQLLSLTRNLGHRFQHENPRRRLLAFFNGGKGKRNKNPSGFGDAVRL